MTKARQNLWKMQGRLDLKPAADVEIHLHGSAGCPCSVPPFAFALDQEDAGAPAPGGPEEGTRPRVAFHIDSSIMLMVLLGAAIWNNVEIAALVEFERVPEAYDPTVHSLMSFFTL